jgi:hypothetical protein
MIRYTKILSLVKELFQKNKQDSILDSCVHLLANLSSNPDYHTFISSEEILSYL